MYFNSFQKGESFESYVLQTLFPEDQYTLIHRTNSFEQNQERFSENTLQPDFKFRCKQSGKEFFVEAKFRSDFNNHNKLEVLTLKQFERYKMFQEQEQCPVFIAVGYEGYANDPENLSLFPLNEFEYLNVYRSKLNEFAIKHEPISSNRLKLDGFSYQEKTEKKKGSKPPNTKVMAYLLATIVLLAIAFWGYSSINKRESSNNIENIETQLQGVIGNYYSILDQGELSKLPDYINPIVDKWYSKENLTLESIISQQKDYQKKYPTRTTKVLWDTFLVEHDDNDYITTYQLDYKLKPRGSQHFKNYKLKITSVWGSNFKLKSMFEDRL
ncbi:hypothetical protein [Mangrovimonas cancribranchiae]|uniref:Uncharacterized protein n=1 Tax=Mangrovimonas cancribranchiae TaxID=3080055 RepID=A0AAU6P7B1_9FLAO